MVVHVVKPFEFNPPRAIYILPHQRFNFGLNHLKKEQVSNIHKSAKVNLPSTQYEWSSLDPKIATALNTGLVEAKNKIDIATIRVNDTRAINHFIENTVNVVAPRRILIRMKDITEDWAAARKEERAFAKERVLTEVTADYWSDY